MPKIFIAALMDDDRRPVLEAWSRKPPTDHAVEQLEATAERFDLAGDVADVAVAAVIACRGCGCTEHRACPGGCSWVEPDLCSRCQSRIYPAGGPSFGGR